MVWKASRATPRQQNRPAMKARTCTKKSSPLEGNNHGQPYQSEACRLFQPGWSNSEIRLDQFDALGFTIVSRKFRVISCEMVETKDESESRID